MLHKDFTAYKENVDLEIINLTNHYEKVENYHKYMVRLFGGVQESPDLDSDEDYQGTIQNS